MYSHEFTVETVTKSPNKHSSKSYFTKKAESTKWMNLVYINFRKNPPSAPLTKVKLEITRITSVQPDKDNLYASCKQLIDALRKNGIITDDAPKHLDLECNWEKGIKGKPKTRIKIKGETE